MSEEIKNEDVVPASVVENEPIITPEVAEKAADLVADILAEAKIEDASKPEEPAKEEQEVITNAQGKSNAEAQVMGEVGNGVIGATTAAEAPKAKKEPKKSSAVIKNDDVAVYSTRNVHWDGVGKLSVGYNIVSKEAAEKWLTRSHVRAAAPEEVAREFLK